jgi:urease accessory protein
MMLPDLRLYQLISPALPVGGFTYSQGLEWAVEARWVHNRRTLQDWLSGLLEHSIATLDLPVLLRLQRAFTETDQTAVEYWCNYLLASRETRELRTEERQRGAALAKLLTSLRVDIPPALEQATASCQVAAMALAASQWDIPPEKTCGGYTWSWLESTVTAGVKLIPLGQTHGQQIILELAEKIPAAVSAALHVGDDDIGSSSPAQAIASSRHETHYTRLFRS